MVLWKRKTALFRKKRGANAGFPLIDRTILCVCWCLTEIWSLQKWTIETYGYMVWVKTTRPFCAPQNSKDININMFIPWKKDQYTLLKTLLLQTQILLIMWATQIKSTNRGCNLYHLYPTKKMEVPESFCGTHWYTLHFFYCPWNIFFEPSSHD